MDFPLGSQHHGMVEVGRDLCLWNVFINTFPESRARHTVLELGWRLEGFVLVKVLSCLCWCKILMEREKVTSSPDNINGQVGGYHLGSGQHYLCEKNPQIFVPVRIFLRETWFRLWFYTWYWSVCPISENLEICTSELLCENPPKEKIGLCNDLGVSVGRVWNKNDEESILPSLLLITKKYIYFIILFSNHLFQTMKW